MQNKRDEYIDQLLSNLKTLEESVVAVKNNDAVPFSFFSESFNKTQQITRLLHEMQMMQIEGMKYKMERLVMFLSESESKNQQPRETPEPHSSVADSFDVPYAVSEDSAATGQHENDNVSENIETKAGEGIAFTRQKSADAIKEAAAVHEGNRFADGIILPSYKNPRDEEQIVSPVKQEPAIPEPEKEENAATTTLNDAIQAPPAVLDLKRGISLNDLFLFQRELFNNDRHGMNNVMIKLNILDNYVSAEAYLRKSMQWNFNDPVVKDFLRVIKRGFE